MNASEREYLPRLDHLRFLAAALVVCFHYFHRFVPDIAPKNLLLSLLDEGHVGIGLFMVISGFIFTQLCLGRTVSYGGFIRNRLIRIYPMFVFGVFISLLVSTYNYHRNYGVRELLEWIIPFRASSVPFSDYFVQLWTIWVEFQFYLIFPFLLVFVERHGVRYLALLLLTLLTVRCLVFLDTGTVRFIAYESILGRLDQFLIGMACALFHRRHATCFARRWLAPVAFLGILAVVAGFNRHGGGTNLNTPLWLIWPWIEAIAWGFFLLAYIQWPINLPMWLETGVARLGSVSFSIYVMHNLVLAPLARHVGVPVFLGLPIADAALASVFIALPLVVLVSILTYVVIEKPFLAFRRPYLSAPGKLSHS